MLSQSLLIKLVTVLAESLIKVSNLSCLLEAHLVHVFFSCSPLSGDIFSMVYIRSLHIAQGYKVNNGVASRQTSLIV